MPTYTHAGIEIDLDELNGKFCAYLNGENVTTTSLAGMRKRIDKENGFKTFTALVHARWDSDKVKRVTVTGIAKARGQHGRAKWKGASGEYDFKIYADTPENEAALNAAHATEMRHSKEMDDMRARHRSEREAAWSSLKELVISVA